MKSALPAFVALLSFLMCAAVRGQQPPAPAPSPGPVRSPAPPPPPAGSSRLPGCLAVDGVYVLDGNQDDVVKLLELSPESGWVRALTKAGESWINIANITTINLASKDAVAQSSLKEKADFIRAGAMAISDAISRYTVEANLPPTAPVKWENIRKYLKAGTPIYNSGGKDVTGRPYILPETVDSYPKVNPDTIKELSVVIDDPTAYWGNFKPAAAPTPTP